MERAWFALLLLGLVGLRNRAGAAVSGSTPDPELGTQPSVDDAHSLQCVFNISFNEQQRCMAKVSMGRTQILKCDCYNKNVIYEKQELKTTNVLKDMTDTLKDVGDKMRMRLSDLKTRKICKDSCILQVSLECQSDANGIFNGSWEFLLDGQRLLVFYPESGKYRPDSSSVEEMREKWENDKEVNQFLRRISVGDCKRWLQVLDRKKVQGATAAPATAAASASPHIVSATPTTATTTVPAPSNAMNIKNISWILAVIFIVILGFVGCAHYRNCYSKAPESGSSSTRARSWWPPFRHLQLPTSDLELQPL